MNWIKKRYDQFLLALLAVGLLVCAILVFLKVQSFGDNFTSATTTIAQDNKVPPVPLEKIDAAKEKVAQPPTWTPTKENTAGPPDRGSLFVSQHYISKEGGAPEKPGTGALYKDSLTGQDIPNTWFMQFSLPLLDPTVPTQDADKDGFTNEDEWRGHTDPTNKDSHPPYYSKLFLDKFIQIPFRLIFKSYDGDPKKHDPISKFSFQIDTIDLRQPSDFLKMGEMVPNTKFKLEKFEFKEAYDASIQDKVDVSELTLTNVDTGDKIVLVYNKITNSPDVYARFVYEWPQPVQLIQVKKLGEFVLRPEVDDQHHYKLLDISDAEAQIQLPSGEKYTVKPDPRRTPGK